MYFVRSSSPSFFLHPSQSVNSLHSISINLPVALFFLVLSTKRSHSIAYFQLLAVFIRPSSQFSFLTFLQRCWYSCSTILATVISFAIASRILLVFFLLVKALHLAKLLCYTRLFIAHQFLTIHTSHLVQSLFPLLSFLRSMIICDYCEHSSRRTMYFYSCTYILRAYIPFTLGFALFEYFERNDIEFGSIFTCDVNN